MRLLKTGNPLPGGYPVLGSFGVVLVACAKPIPGCSDAENAESLAVREGLLVAKSWGIKVDAESNTRKVI